MIPKWRKIHPGTIILAAISTLPPPQLSYFTTSLSTLFRYHQCRLSSPALLSLSLRHLRSLSLNQKSLLVARHLLTMLSHLSHFLQCTKSTAICPLPYATSLRDLDSGLLLLLLCELHKQYPECLKTSPSNWHASLSDYVMKTTLTLSGIVFSNSEVLVRYIESVSKCRKYVDHVMRCRGNKEGKEVAASTVAMVALPSVEVRGERKECVICKEEMREGRDVCELPCDHQFHWMCILSWLMKMNTCPYCCHQLPTDDVYYKIEWQWEVLVKISGSGGGDL